MIGVRGSVEAACGRETGRGRVGLALGRNGEVVWSRLRDSVGVCTACCPGLSMRVLKHVLAILGIAAVVAAVAVFWPRGWSYGRFMGQTPGAFLQFAQACEVLRQAHPTGTNRVVRLSGREPSVPVLVRRVAPSEIRVYPNRLWIGVGTDRNAYAILWEPDPVQTNAWVLLTDYDGMLRKVYSEIRQ